MTEILQINYKDGDKIIIGIPLLINNPYDHIKMSDYMDSSL